MSGLDAAFVTWSEGEEESWHGRTCELSRAQTQPLIQSTAGNEKNAGYGHIRSYPGNPKALCFRTQLLKAPKSS